MVKLKFCGMTNLDDCKKAVELGADYVGFVFYKKSSRYVAPHKVRRITEKLDKKVHTVGVFVEETDQEIEETVDYCGLDLAQVYRESAIENRITVYRIAGTCPDTVGKGLILFDSYTEGFGGSGRSFDFNMLRKSDLLERAFIAGGINEQNVQDVLRLNPFGIDLVSFVEACPGKKDHGKMENFVKIVRSYAT